MRAFPIRDDADLARAIDLVGRLWDAAPGSPEADLRDVMAELIEHYEAEELARVLPPPDPRRIIDAKRKELGLSQRRLGELLGWRSTGRVSEVLSGRRRLTIDMVRDLERVSGIQPGLLVADRSPTTEGYVSVRLPAHLADLARRTGLGGCDGFEEMVGQAVTSWLGRPGHTVATSADGSRLSGRSCSPVRGAACSFAWNAGVA